jgi:hypothetical protein
LKNKSSDPAVLKKRLTQISTDMAAARARITDLQGRLAKANSEGAKSSPEDFASVHKANVVILSAPSEHASVLLKPETDDEFSVLERRGAWLRVQLDEGHSGWVMRSQVQSSPTDVQSSSRSDGTEQNPFTVFRESSDSFSGDWPRLQGKQALYVWAQPSGPVTEEDRISFARRVFRERYREASHVSHNPLEGIVIIFMDARGAVAAAAMDDIRLWTQGAISETAFLNKCSLDPKAAFELPHTGKTPKRAATKMSAEETRASAK